MWQRRLRLAIALLVVVFAGAVVVSLRRGHKQRATTTSILRSDPKAAIENRGDGVYERWSEGKKTFSLKFGKSLTYPDGRTRLLDGVRVELPDKAGRRVIITSREATVLNPPDKEFAHAEFHGGVKLDTSDGVTITSPDATYDQQEGIGAWLLAEIDSEKRWDELFSRPPSEMLKRMGDEALDDHRFGRTSPLDP